MLAVRDHEQAPGRRRAECHETPFVERMIRIVTCCRQRIKEHTCSLRKGYTVFPQVRGSL